MPLQLPQTVEASDICRAYIVRAVATRNFNGDMYTYARHPNYLAEVTTEENIQAVLDHDVSLASCSQADKNRLVAQIRDGAEEMFAICVLGHVSMGSLRSMLDYLSDTDLPLSSVLYDDVEYPEDFRRFLSVQNELPQVINLARCYYFEEGDFLSIPPANTRIPIQTGRPLGKGVAGSVMEAWLETRSHNFQDLATDPDHITLSQKVAIKVVTRKSHAKRERAFLHHLASSGISHNHIAKFYTGFRFGGSTYLISELATKSLKDLMKTEDMSANDLGLDLPWLHKQFTGLAGALAVIHGPINNATAFHHDIKPSNILVFADDDHTLKFTDFGHAGTKPYDEEHDSAGTEKHGDVRYLPPEQHRGLKTSRPYDIWSLGYIFVQLLVLVTEGPEVLAKLGKGTISGRWFTTNVVEISEINKLMHIATENEMADQETHESADEGTMGRTVVVYELMPALISTLRHLRAKSWALRKWAGVLEGMLKVEPKDRTTAKDLGHQLEAIEVWGS